MEIFMANPDGAVSVLEAATEIESNGLLDKLMGWGTEEVPGAPQVQVEESDDDTEEVEASAEEDVVDADAEEVADANDDDVSDDEAETELETVAQVAEALGVDIDDLEANLSTTVRVDGRDHSVTLAELRNGYSRDADYRKKTMALAEARKTHESQVNTARQQLEAQAQVVGATMRQMEQMLLGEKSEIDRLRDSDPQRWAVESAKWQDRSNQFQQMQQSAYQWYAQNQHQLKQEQQASRQTLEQRERESLADAMSTQFQAPWNDDRARQLGDYLTQQFAAEDIASILDHRFFVLAEKARLYDQAKRDADPAKKRVKSVPKIQKPAKKIAVKNSAFEKARTRFNKSRTREDAAAAIANMPGFEGLLR